MTKRTLIAELSRWAPTPWVVVKKGRYADEEHRFTSQGAAMNYMDKQAGKGYSTELYLEEEN